MENTFGIIYDILGASWVLYLDVAIFMLFGFLIAGLLYVFFNADQVKRHLGTGKIRPVFLSSLFGIPLPLCSCGVVPVAASLKKQGANSGAALSFMISTPESGVDSIAVSWAMLDPLMTVIRPVAAFITAVSTGIAQNFFGSETPDKTTPDLIKEPGGCGCAAGTCATGQKNPALPLLQRLKNGLTYAFGELLSDIARPFVIGMLIAGAITFFFPEDLTVWANEHTFLSMLVMLAAGIPMYVCATSSTPIAAALILKGLNPGAALVFLLAGPATNAATINIVKNIFNTRALVIYLSMIAVCSLAMGLLVDWIYLFLHLEATALVGQASEVIPRFLQLTGAVILTILLLFHGINGLRQRIQTRQYFHAQ
ncbi:MAG TPA: SO_0444 family Cu/Zn efflux transporter [Desulfotignum sp.]|nr:SO_0444 family Cu/Zn efflux transporter [Desulfotignum sp.]